MKIMEFFFTGIYIFSFSACLGEKDSDEIKIENFRQELIEIEGKNKKISKEFQYHSSEEYKDFFAKKNQSLKRPDEKVILFEKKQNIQSTFSLENFDTENIHQYFAHKFRESEVQKKILYDGYEIHFILSSETEIWFSENIDQQFKNVKIFLEKSEFSLNDLKYVDARIYGKIFYLEK